MQRLIRITIFLIASLCSLSALSLPAFALTLSEAKNQGLVGEQANGYLGVVKNTAAVNAVVSDINQKRREEYARIAKQNGTDLSVVENLAGKKAIGLTEGGHFYQNEHGQWVKK